jgi:TIGR03009 family protein
MHAKTLSLFAIAFLSGLFLSQESSAQWNTHPATGAPLAAPTAVGPQALAAPSWIPLNEKHQQYVDQILAYWEHKSSQVKRYRCQFRRWEYDPVFGPKDTYKTFSEGVIKYAEPDKGLFRVESVQQYQAAKEPGGQATYVPAAKETGEHWVCDGHWVYQYDHRRSELVQTELPPEMRGQAIGSGPLPFLFNAKADDIKRRFWLRVVTPTNVQGEYHLEAVPRTQEDAANFKMVRVVIDMSDYLPKAMVVFDRNFSADTPTRTTFEFRNREVNFSILAEQLNFFHREFYEPAVPSGWTKRVQKWNEPMAAAPGAPTTARTPDPASELRR